MQDRWGNPISCGAACAVALLDEAITLLNSFQVDPVKTIDSALEGHPDFVLGHAFKAALFATTVDKQYAHLGEASLKAAEAQAGTANEREQAHIRAVRHWQDGEMELATEAWGRIAIQWPRDILAIQLAQLGDFYLGNSLMLRDRLARVMPHWNPNVPGYGFVLGMYAFGLEEAGEYRKAEDAGREAVGRNGHDAWAVHAVAHVLEMEGRAREGVEWLDATGPGWEPNSGFYYHNWWHKALFKLDLQDLPGVLKLFDDSLASGGFTQALSLVDGSSLLWRMTTLGHDVGERWQLQAKQWEARVEDGVYAFNDLHAAMAFAGAERFDLLERLEATAIRVAAGTGSNAMMTREVGLPGIRGIAAFGRSAYADAVNHILPVMARTNRFGGSHAQRDIFSWTATEAALRAGDRRMADALINERLALKPNAAVNLAWAERARALV